MGRKEWYYPMALMSEVPRRTDRGDDLGGWTCPGTESPVCGFAPMRIRSRLGPPSPERPSTGRRPCAIWTRQDACAACEGKGQWDCAPAGSPDLWTISARFRDDARGAGAHTVPWTQYDTVRVVLRGFGVLRACGRSVSVGSPGICSPSVGRSFGRPGLAMLPCTVRLR